MMWKLSMFQERTFHWLTRCLELTHSQATQSKVLMYQSMNCTSNLMPPQQGSMKLKRKQLKMKFSSHSVQLSHKVGLIQDRNAQPTYMHIGIIAMN